MPRAAQLLALRDAVRAGEIRGSTTEMARQVRAILEGVAVDQPAKVWPPEATQAYRILPLWNQGVDSFEISKQLKIPMDNIAVAAAAWRNKGARVLDRRERTRAAKMVKDGKATPGTDFAALFDAESAGGAGTEPDDYATRVTDKLPPVPPVKVAKRQPAAPPESPAPKRTVAEMSSGLNLADRTVGLSFDQMVGQPQPASPRLLLLERLANTVRVATLIDNSNDALGHLHFCRGIVEAIDALEANREKQ